MPQKVKFRSATLKEFGRGQNGAWARFEFPLTTSAINAMEWGELGEYETKTCLKGDLAASVIELIPSDDAMKRQCTQVEVQRIYRFVAVRQEMEGSRGKGTRWIVQCDVLVRDVAGCQKLEGYFHAVPKGDVWVSYERQPEQADIPGTEPDTSQSKMPLQ